MKCVSEVIKIYILQTILGACSFSDHYEVPPIDCKPLSLKTTNSLAQLYDFTSYANYTFTEERIVAGYLISNDASGNIYKTIYLQDSPDQPTIGIQIALEQTYLYTLFPMGTKIYIQLKGLTFGYRFGTLQLGKLIDGRLSPIPTFEIASHLFRTCESYVIKPLMVSLDSDISAYKNRLIRITNTQFEKLGEVQSYGEIGDNSTVEREVFQFSDNCHYLGSIPLKISGFADFKEAVLPKNKGVLTGIVGSYYDDQFLLIRDTLDVVFDQEACNQVTHTQPTISFETLQGMYQGTAVEFGDADPLWLECFVISSDVSGNFTNELFVQDALENPTAGLRVLHNEVNLHERFQPGDKCLLRLNRLYLDKIGGILTLGYASENSVTEIALGRLQRHLLVLEKGGMLVPQSLHLSTLELEGIPQTLIRLKDIQITASEKGKAFAYYSGALPAIRTLESCGVLKNGYLYTEGTASFAATVFPIQQISLTGVLYRNGKVLNLKIRTPNDIEVLGDYQVCQRVPQKVMITEIADPANNTKARFVELYNPSDFSVSLDYWSLRKYTNATNSYSEVDLSGFIIDPNSFVVLGNTDFGMYFDTLPWLSSSFISGNGDDAYVLFNEQGLVQDVYGVPLEDGSGTWWDYTDGKAIRKIEIDAPNVNFTLEEWEIYSKSLGTSQNVPDDFKPFKR
ncbi:MAG: DUF5689 domain-containing protein [Flavicella sp.]